MKAVTHYQINSAITLAKISNVAFLCWNFSHHINWHTNMLSKCILSTSGSRRRHWFWMLWSCSMLTWTVHSDQVRWNIGRARGPPKSSGQLKYMEKKKIVTNYAFCCSTTMFTSKIMKETIENVFHSMFINHKITNDTHDMKMTPLPPLSLFCKVRGQCYRFLVSVLTAISSHCLEALPVCAQQSHDVGAAKRLIS